MKKSDGMSSPLCSGKDRGEKRTFSWRFSTMSLNDDVAKNKCNIKTDEVTAPILTAR